MNEKFKHAFNLKNRPKSAKSRPKLIQLINMTLSMHIFIRKLADLPGKSPTPARLEYFIISNTLTDLITESNIKYGHRSDHSFIELII